LRKQTAVRARSPKWTFDKGLPTGFVVYKPLQQGAYDDQVIKDLERAGRLVITRKRDGWKVFIWKACGRTKFYTDGLNEIEGRLDHLKIELAKQLPDRTLLVGEAIVDDNDGDQFTDVCRLMKSSRWQEIQTETGAMKLMLFEAIFWEGRCLLDLPYNTRYGILLSATAFTKQVFPTPILQVKFEEATEYARKHGWEGLVLYDGSFIASFRLDGKNPARLRGCYKWKPLCEDDFIVRTRILDPKYKDRLKEVVLSQIDPVTGQEFYCGKLGSFITEMRTRLLRTPLPFVMQVVFEDRYPSGTLRNARFERLRLDKKPKACIAPKSFLRASAKKLLTTLKNAPGLANK